MYTCDVQVTDMLICDVHITKMCIFTRYGEGALSSERLKKKAVTGIVTCLGQNEPLAPISAVNPSTTPLGSSRPFSMLSYNELPKLLQYYPLKGTGEYHVINVRL